MRDPLAVLSRRDAVARTLPWAEQKAMVLLVAMHGDWNGASQLADALGVDEVAQEAIYHEAQSKRAELAP